MRDGMDERRKAFEEKWVHDEELRFRVHARWAKLAGLWAADLIGLSGQAAQEYAAACVVEDVDKDGDAHVEAKIAADLDNAKAPVSDMEIKHQLDNLRMTAREQIMNEVREF